MYAVVDVSEHGQSMGYYFEPLSMVKLELKFLPVHGYTLAAHEWLMQVCRCDIPAEST